MHSARDVIRRMLKSRLFELSTRGVLINDITLEVQMYFVSWKTDILLPPTSNTNLSNIFASRYFPWLTYTKDVILARRRGLSQIESSFPQFPHAAKKVSRHESNFSSWFMSFYLPFFRHLIASRFHKWLVMQ